MIMALHIVVVFAFFYTLPSMKSKRFILSITLYIMSLLTFTLSVGKDYFMLDEQKLIEHNLLQHNSKTGELEPVGKLKELMEEVK